MKSGQPRVPKTVDRRMWGALAFADVREVQHLPFHNRLSPWAPACRPGCDAAPPHGDMGLILSTAAEPASAPRAGGNGGDAALGLAPDSMGGAFLGATAGAGAGARADAVGQDGS